MIVFKNMRWEEIDFELKDDLIFITLLRKGKHLKGTVSKSNEVTKVYRISLEDGREADIVDFELIDSFFEKNMIIFKNREGLHREIRRYIDYSL
ncbi:MAG: hypothetical protein N3C60_08365 [Calditerrivibrio sp.]|nr:hypothetical protein [Calditerrivibrio sp.]